MGSGGVYAHVSVCMCARVCAYTSAHGNSREVCCVSLSSPSSEMAEGYTPTHHRWPCMHACTSIYPSGMEPILGHLRMPQGCKLYPSRGCATTCPAHQSSSASCATHQSFAILWHADEVTQLGGLEIIVTLPGQVLLFQPCQQLRWQPLELPQWALAGPHSVRHLCVPTRTRV